MTHTTSTSASETLAEAFSCISRIAIAGDSEPVCRTVAEAVQRSLAPKAKIEVVAGPVSGAGSDTLLVGIAGDSHLGDFQVDTKDGSWMRLALPVGGPVTLSVSHRHLLYGLFSRIEEEWGTEPAEAFRSGRVEEPTFHTLAAEDNCYGFWRRFTVGYDAEEAVQEMARLGSSQVIVNSLPHPMAMEDGPDGEIYFRFYQYLPDLDQYVETDLNHGIYPPEYLQENLEFLREQAQLALKYGITPGMHIANPRSAPEELLRKYPYLRGARIDHPFRSYLPRYTLSLAHPLVRWHYATLVKNLLEEIPEIGFFKTLINDSGAGFEYTESLYAGRNGGPYVVREWRPDDVIARKAAEQVIRYYRLLRDAAREVNPDFRIQMSLHNIREETEIIYEGLEDGLDRLALTQRDDITDNRERDRLLEARESYRIGDTSAKGSTYVIGVPSPLRTYRNLLSESEAGTTRLTANFDPPSTSPYNIDREVLRSFQLSGASNLDAFLRAKAEDWVGAEHGDALCEIWRLSDAAVSDAPNLVLYGGQGFAWYRFWVRPFVPDIEAIPVKDRAYYEDYTLTHFNNPHNIDLQADALWDIHSLEQCEGYLAQFDGTTLPAIEKALARATALAQAVEGDAAAQKVADDLQVRLRAYRCYSVTLRNIAAWIVGVHGYLDTEDAGERAQMLKVVQEMVRSELANTRDLLDLWNGTDLVFMPIHERSEWMHDFGPNFGKLLAKKIELMERYGDLPPRIDPDYMWRLPATDEVERSPNIDPSVYMNY